MWSLTWLPDSVKGGLISKQPSSCVQIIFRAPSTHRLISAQAKDGLEGEEATGAPEDAVRVQERRAVGLERRVEGCGAALVRAAPLPEDLRGNHRVVLHAIDATPDALVDFHTVEDVEHLRGNGPVLPGLPTQIIIPQ